MAEVNKLSTSTRKADTQSVTKRYVPDAASDLRLSLPSPRETCLQHLLTLLVFPTAYNPN
jgi:hypothetical protein